MEVNEERGPFGVCPETGCEDMRTVDLENVLTHEFGHYLGLAHTTDPEATMFASAVAGEILKRDLGSDDIAGICAVYPAGTPTGECDPAPRGGLRLDCGEGGSGCSAIPSTRPGARSGLLLLPLLLLLLWVAHCGPFLSLCRFAA